MCKGKQKRQRHQRQERRETGRVGMRDKGSDPANETA
jgi:hypothetical protein